MPPKSVSGGIADLHGHITQAQTIWVVGEAISDAGRTTWNQPGLVSEMSEKRK